MRGLALALLAGCSVHRPPEILPPPAPEIQQETAPSPRSATGMPGLVAAWGAAGLPDQALDEARSAARAAPEDPEALAAWVRAMRAAGTDWSLASELSALGDAPLPSLVRAWAAIEATPRDPAAWEALAEAASRLPGPGALLEAEALLAAGDARAALRALDGRLDADAVRLAVRALAEAGDPRTGAALVLEALARNPRRPDVAVGLWGRGVDERGLGPARHAAVEAAVALLGSADPVSLFRAWEVLARAGHPAVGESARRLARIVPGLVLPPRLPFGAVMLRHLGEAAAQGGGPLPADLTPAERAGIHRAEARWRSRAGHPLAAEAWERACVDADPACLLEAAEALLSRDPSRAAGFAGRARAALGRMAPGLDPGADATLRMRILSVEAESLAAAGSDRALEALSEAVPIAPTPDLAAARARLLETSGAREAALAAWAEAGALGHPDAEAALGRLYEGPAEPVALVEAARRRLEARPDPEAITAATQPPPGSPEAVLATARLATDAGPLALSDLRGRTVVIAFWASWCAPCKDELNALAHAAAAWRAGGLGVWVLAVSVDEREDAYQAGRRRFGVEGLTVARAPELAGSLGVRAIPSTWILGPSGRVEWEARGYGPDSIEDLDREVRRLASPNR
ncbi:MAG: TlpA family protein disulfide reductase [Deltaproteobacteria bacterium]|nr:TlpA family protein disulfide reductase [Deltaproteobacteria bacterium]